MIGVYEGVKESGVVKGVYEGFKGFYEGVKKLGVVKGVYKEVKGVVESKEDKKEREEQNELKADNNTIMSGSLDDKYLIKLSEFGIMSKRRDIYTAYQGIIKQMIPKYEGIIFNLADRTFHDIVIGYKWYGERKQARAVMLNGNTKERTTITTKLTDTKFELTVKDSKKKQIS